MVSNRLLGEVRFNFTVDLLYLCLLSNRFIDKKGMSFMNYDGIIIGLTSFLIIGLFHPIVIKAEYYIGKKIWPVFLILGIILIAISLFIDQFMISALAGLTGFAFLWSIHEVIKQEERVAKGWFPANPNKKRDN